MFPTYSCICSCLTTLWYLVYLYNYMYLVLICFLVYWIVLKQTNVDFGLLWLSETIVLCCFNNWKHGRLLGKELPISEAQTKLQCTWHVKHMWFIITLVKETLQPVEIQKEVGKGNYTVESFITIEVL